MVLFIRDSAVDIVTRIRRSRVWVSAGHESCCSL